MESFMRRGRQWGRVVSVLFALLALARARQQSEVEFDLLSPAIDIYTGGPFDVDNFVPSAATRPRPPHPLRIAAPKANGTYPVVQFEHGYMLETEDYSLLLHHVASYGFIVVAPKLDIISDCCPNAKPEIKAAKEVTYWLQKGLLQALSKRLTSLTVKPELDKLALVGHSRGGKLVFGLATGVYKTRLNFSAIVGLDPVDGTSPRILKNITHDLKLGMPTLIVGGGLSSQPKTLNPPCGWWNETYPPCGPPGLSHQEFFDESDAPAFHFVAPNNGHMDYLNGECFGKYSNLSTCCLCNNGLAGREPMRNFSAGITVAFLNAYLNKDASQFSDAITNYLRAPLNLTKPEIYGNLPDFLVTQEA